MKIVENIQIIKMTDKKWRVALEYVCDNNSSLSPMAEAIARDTIHTITNGKWMRAYSSGSGLHELNQKYGEEKREQMEKAVTLALQNELYPEPWRRFGVEFELRMSFFDAFEHSFKDTLRIDGIFRDQALLEMGLLANRSYEKPTIADVKDDEWKIILTMTSEQVEQVKRIYIRSKFKPSYIGTINDYTGMSAIIPNPFCQKLPQYREARDILLQLVPKTVERAVQEFISK